MESNAMTTYKDTTPAARVDNKTLNKMVWRSMQLHASWAGSTRKRCRRC